MRIWQFVIIIILLLAAAGAVLAFPPGSMTISQNSQFASPSQTPDLRILTLFFVGDVMLSRSVGEVMAARQDWLWPFRQVASLSAEADLTFGNLETTISTRGVQSGCGYCFRADPKVVQGLTYMGFDIMSIANNHTHDYGPDAFTDTLTYLRSSGISPVGYGESAIRTVNDTRVAYLAYTYPLNQARITVDIASMRPQADVLVVSLHNGTEYEMTHNAEQERIYQSAIDSGADLVIGSHPHVVQEVVQYKNGWIAYSLGNFVFDQNWSAETMRGLALSVQIQNKKVIHIQSIPVNISRQYQPSFAEEIGN